MAVDRFDTLPDGRDIHRVVLGAEPGVVLHLLTLGATVQRLDVTCGDGVRRGVALGRPTAAGYLAATDYLGGTIGRYATRIAHGRFDLDGQPVTVGVNDRGHHLHGGPDGFDRRLWTVEAHDATSASLRLRSPHGDQGFPGTLDVVARFEVEGSRVGVAFEATSDRTTVVNLTSHVYWNLDGVGAGPVDDHELTVAADRFTPVDPLGIPLGEHAEVAGTGFDCRVPTRIGTVLGSDEAQIRQAGGLDHNYVIRGTGMRTAAVLVSRSTRTRMELRTDQPGLQVYSGTHLDEPRSGVALEPQLFPDSPHHPAWPTARLEPGQTYRAALSWDLSPHRESSADRPAALAPA